MSEADEILRARRRLDAGTWPDQGDHDRVALFYDDRWRRRIMLETQGGRSFLLDLAEAEALREGDGLELESGEIIKVLAAPEPVADIHCDDSRHLGRIAWHLGNRHLPTQILTENNQSVLRIRHDHVIEAMVEGLGARVDLRDAPFDPEGGAYGKGRTHGHEDLGHEDLGHEHSDHAHPGHAAHGHAHG
ncbi:MULTISPECIES: urease accessory protein UreE [unclassified Iodidimonas]|jgi:urease accessory protein|uniref:urease accessory protein UreE n=1 Tax=unclassified Iodidimonas TaxID=2626145 RepID=UPI002482232E|nr:MULTISPECIES: urease accessory protein UreE [unclassified Iodidimonas]